MVKYLIFVFVFLFVFTSPVSATFALNINSVEPDSVNSIEQEVVINFQIQDLPSDSYFRAGWQKSSGATYFGYVKNNAGDWVRVESGQDCKNYFFIDTSTTSATLITKIGDGNEPVNGVYSIKLRRYTSTCSSYKDSDPISININLPTPTPTDTPTSTPTVTPTSTPTVTPTKTPTPTPTRSPTPKPTATSSLASTESAEFNLEGEILGLRNELTSPSPSPLAEASTKKKVPFFAYVFLGLGALALSFGGYLLFSSRRREYTGNADENGEKEQIL